MLIRCCSGMVNQCRNTQKSLKNYSIGYFPLLEPYDTVCIFAAMLRLNNLVLTQFKNYKSSGFKFNSRVVGICGQNGKGKTNLLDAIYYLTFTKSYFSRNDAQNVHFADEGFRITGEITEANERLHKIVCIYRNGGKKEILLDESPYEKFSHHIGKFPCVMVAPDDIEMISGVSEERRKFIDTIISQLDPGYLQQLIIYNKILLQRNSLLKRFSEQGSKDWHLLDVLDNQLIQSGVNIYEKRKKFTSQYIPIVYNFYQQIADNDESVSLIYESILHDNSFSLVLKSTRERDLLLQRTTAGIHKDDLQTLLNKRPFKYIASQGQRKSLLFALKLAEYEVLKINKGFPPLLLLDDVFEKLDALRMKNLLEWVCVNNEGQVFITDTHPERLTSSLNICGNAVQIIHLD